MFSIPHLSPRDFCLPILNVRARHSARRAGFVVVPKATMDEQRNTVARKSDVGFSGQLAIMKAKAKPATVKQGSHHPFGASVLAANTSHDVATFFDANEVHHTFSDIASDQFPKARTVSRHLRGNRFIAIATLEKEARLQQQIEALRI